MLQCREGMEGERPPSETSWRGAAKKKKKGYVSDLCMQIIKTHRKSVLPLDIAASPSRPTACPAAYLPHPLQCGCSRASLPPPANVFAQNLKECN